ncbi:MAG: SigB/SigF/SigG family RNA polymerase sigma factor [Erysipelotrichaceae bacterium]|nr:SigB/SigF/SigG family RNA polymerase sigma factor [Erysipelotrichaceae bacterium]
MARFKVEISGVNTAQLPVLTNKEMTQLFLQYQSGDTNAKEKLVEGNLKLVLSMVQRFIYRTENLDDLFQIGCIGLMKAIDHFDLKHEVRFSTYAVPMIIGEMKRYLRDSQMVKVSRQLKDQSYKCLRFKEEYLQMYQKEATYQEIADELVMSIKDVSIAMETLQSVVSIFEPLFSEEGETISLIDQIQDPNNEIHLMQDRISLEKSLQFLSEKEKEIIFKRYYCSKTQTEIARELDISQAQVSRIEKSALECLKKNL